MSDDRPFLERPGVAKKLLIGLGVLVLGWLFLGGSEDEPDWEELQAAGFEEDFMPGVAAGFPDMGEFDEEDFVEELGYGDAAEYGEGFDAGYGYDAGGGGTQGGQNWGGDAGAWRGEASVGGMPVTSGTVDQSGGGNSVHSVGGKVIELP